MRIRARIKTDIGRTRHLLGTVVPGRIETVKIPHPEIVEIVKQEGACYLLRLNATGESVADTWHESVKAAKAQASFEFGIKEEDWEVL